MNKDTVDIPTTADDDELIPRYSTDDASGADVKAALEAPLVLVPGASSLIPTGIRVSIPPGYEIQVRPRSGLALKYGVTILNTPGTIDADYRGEIGVIMINHGAHDFVIQPRMRIAQLVVAPVTKATFINVKELATTIRGEGGFGHTGV